MATVCFQKADLDVLYEQNSTKVERINSLHALFLQFSEMEEPIQQSGENNILATSNKTTLICI
jgi:hypothetical protein